MMAGAPCTYSVLTRPFDAAGETLQARALLVIHPLSLPRVWLTVFLPSLPRVVQALENQQSTLQRVFVGFWSESVECPSVEELEGRMPGRDASKGVTCTLNATTGNNIRKLSHLLCSCHSQTVHC